MIGRKYAILDKDGGDGLQDQTVKERLNKPGHWQGEMWQQHSLGGVFSVSVNLDAVRDESHQITHLVSVFTDITLHSDLRRFPIHELKIDRSFIHSFTQIRQDADLVVSILDLAHNLGLSVVAEGVETVEQIQFLKVHSCESLQGDFLCPAVPVEKITKLLHQKKQAAQKTQKPQGNLSA